MKKRVFVVWAKGEAMCSNFLAKGINAEVLVSFSKEFNNALFRYPLQAIDTYKKLRQGKPVVILVQNPPIFATLVAYIYCKFNNARFIIETHTAGFMDKKWKFFHFLHRFLSKRALLNTVHNYKDLEKLKSWGLINSMAVQFYTPLKNEILDENFQLDKEIKENLEKYALKVFMVNRFANDDVYLEVTETAKIMPDTAFLITGDYTKLKNKNNLPKNVILTGLLEHREFMKLMDESDIVLSLTKRQNTLLWSVREAMALEKPIVISDTEVLRYYYGNFAIFTNNTPADLKEKILQAQRERIQIQTEIKKSILVDRAKWNQDIAELERIIEC